MHLKTQPFLLYLSLPLFFFLLLPQLSEPYTGYLRAGGGNLLITCLYLYLSFVFLLFISFLLLSFFILLLPQLGEPNIDSLRAGGGNFCTKFLILQFLSFLYYYLSWESHMLAFSGWVVGNSCTFLFFFPYTLPFQVECVQLPILLRDTHVVIYIDTSIAEIS